MLYDILVKLLPSQFDEVVFRVSVPVEYMASTNASQATRAIDLIRYCEQQTRRHELIAAIEKVRGKALDLPNTKEPIMPLPMTDYMTRPIHTAHETGFDAVVIESAALKGANAEKHAAKLRRRIFTEGTTYAELANHETFDRAAVDRAIDRLIADGERTNATPEMLELAEHLRELPSSRNGEIALALRLVAPARRYCTKCGRLDLLRVAGRWTVQTGDYCLARIGAVECRGLFKEVVFVPDVVSWVNGTRHAPGTTHAPDGTPLTDDAIRAQIAQDGLLHPWLASAMEATQNALSLADLASYLLRTGATRNPLATLDALANPRSAQIAMNADALTVLCQKALAAKNVTVATAETPNGGTVEVVVADKLVQGSPLWDRALRNRLTALYPHVANVKRVCFDAGVKDERVNFNGTALDMWYSAINEAKNSNRLSTLFALAFSEYPDDPVLQSLRG